MTSDDDLGDAWDSEADDDPLPDPDSGSDNDEGSSWRDRLPSMPSRPSRPSSPDVDVAGATSRVWARIKSPVYHLLALVITGWVVWKFLGWLWVTIGPIMTIASVVVALISAFLIPVTVLLFGPSFPGFLRGFFGTTHWFLGQLVYGSTYLVEVDDEYHLCPGSAERYYLDGEWHDIDAGQSNRSVILGMPFGLINHKEETTFEDLRQDAIDTRADGGATRKRGSIKEFDGGGVADEKWQIDLVRLGADGLLEAGDARIIEEAEMDQLEEIASGSRLDGWKPMIAMLVGIIMGALTGLLMTGAV